MKNLLTLAAALSISLSGSAFGAELANNAQAARQLTLKLVKEVQAQQIMIAENQAKIDAKVAALGEQIQVAKVFASRAGR